jgi:hypothetical protein
MSLFWRPNTGQLQIGAVVHNYRTFPQKVFDTVLGIRPDILNDVTSPAAYPDHEPLDILLKKCATQIKTQAVDAATGKIDYVQLKGSDAYRDYRQMTALLPGFKLENLVQREQKMAFWLNLYNALVIDGIIHYGIRTTVKEMTGFFRRVAYYVGGYRFNLDDIEHGILRANAGHPVIPGSQFGQNDPRRQFALDHIDYRIHFALVCGAESCPPINFYDAGKIDAQLDLASQNFLEQHVEIDPQRRIIRLSKLLQWYSDDFGASAWVKLGIGDKARLLQTIKPHIVDDEKRANIEAASRSMKIHFKPYKWALNTLNTV